MEKYLEIVKIVSVHGIRGEVNAQAWCDSPEVFCKLKKLYSKDGEATYKVERSRPKGNSMVILKLKGVDTAEAAQAMRNTVLDRKSVV